MTVQLKIMQNQHRYLSFDIESKYAKIKDFQNLLSMVFGHLPFLDPTSVCLQCESRTERMFWIPREYMCIHIYYTIWIVWEVVPYLYISLWIYTFALFGKNFLLPSWCFSAPHRGVPVRRLARDIAAPWSERPIPHPNSG